MIKRILVLFILGIFLFGCSSVKDATGDAQPEMPNQSSTDEQKFCTQDVKECPDASFVGRDPEKNCEFRECPETEIKTQEPASVLLPDEIKAMQVKIASIKNYEYVDSTSSNIVLVKGNKIVMITSDSGKYRYNEISYNAIFLDTKEKTAFAACIDDTKGRKAFSCNKYSRKYTKLEYADFSIPDPFKEIRELENGIISGSQGCENRQCDLIDYTKDSKKYRMWVRRIYVLPYKIAQLDDEGREVSQITYTDASFDHLKEEEMNVPSGFALVE